MLMSLAMPSRTAFATLALLFLAAGTAAAQPSIAPAPTPAPVLAPPPQNYDWNELSHINGQLVPVGERGNYLYKSKKTNISTNPIGWVMGLYGVSASHALSDNIAIRADVNYYKPVGGQADGYEVGVGLPLYFRRTYLGAFLEPGVIVRQWNDTYYDDVSAREVSANPATIGPQCLIGWHWSWDSGFNMAVAAGIGRNLNASGNDHYDAEAEIFANGYMRIGYAF